MMTHVLADARGHPVMEPYHAYWARAVDVLLAPWKARGRRRTLLRAGIALALSFDTWRTLVREQGLTDEQALELMVRLTCEHALDPDAGGAAGLPTRAAEAPAAG
jgi:hypothetical protein